MKYNLLGQGARQKESRQKETGKRRKEREKSFVAFPKKKMV
jgi:hypothetical protein